MSNKEIVQVLRNYDIDYVEAPLPALSINHSESMSASGVTTYTPTSAELEGRNVEVTDRFMTSLYSRFGLSPSILTVMPPQEVLERLTTTRSDIQVRFAISNPGDGNEKLLAVSSPSRPVIEPGTLMRHLSDETIFGRPIRHMVTTNPWQAEICVDMSGFMGTLSIGTDIFEPSLYVEVPFDGYGQPATYLELFRLVCTNLMVARSKVWRSGINASGDDPVGEFLRVLSTFSNERGYDALIRRLQMAEETVVSMDEVFTVVHLLNKLSKEGKGAYGLVRSLEERTGNLSDMYSVASANSLPQKRRRVLPMGCTMGVLIRFVTEVATHHSERLKETLPLESYIGTLLSSQFDLEGLEVGNSVDSSVGDFLICAKRLNEYDSLLHDAMDRAAASQVN